MKLTTDDLYEAIKFLGHPTLKELSIKLDRSKNEIAELIIPMCKTDDYTKRLARKQRSDVNTMGYMTWTKYKEQ